MRNTFLIVLLSLLAACNSADQSAPSENPAPPAVTEAKDFKTIDTALSFSGYWVNAKYAAAVRQSKSPSRTTIPEKSAIKIPARTLQETSMVYNFHEGGDECVFVKNGDHYELWDAALKKKREDVVVTGESIRIGKDEFVRTGSGADAGAPPILEALLFKGKYELEDGSQVEFTANGEIKGLPGFSYYAGVIDYFDQGMQIDQIEMGKNSSTSKNYGFKFDKDNLLIYEIKCVEFDKAGNNCAVVDFGKQVYRLRKVG